MDAYCASKDTSQLAQDADNLTIDCVLESALESQRKVAVILISGRVSRTCERGTLVSHLW